MADPYVGTTVSAFAKSVTGDHTLAHTVDSGTKLLVVAIGLRNNNTSETIDGVTWNTTEDLTQASGAQAKYSQYIGVDCWYLVNPTAGSYNIVADHSGTAMRSTLIAFNVLGDVDTSSPVSGITSTTGTTNASNAVTSASGSLVIDVLCSASDPTVGSGQTEVGAADASQYLTVSREAGASSVTMSWTGNGNYAWAGLSIDQTGGATTYTRTASADAAIAPQTPSGLAWTGKDNDEVSLSFTDNTDGGAQHYIFYRKSSDTTWTLDAALPLGTTTHTVYYLDSGTSYDFGVAAFTGSIVGPFDTITTSTLSSQKVAYLDAVVAANLTQTVDLDAFLSAGAAISVSLDALLFGEAAVTVGLDAYIKDPNFVSTRRVSGRFV